MSISMSMVGGKILTFEDPIGFKSKVNYQDQSGNCTDIDMEKFYNLAKKSKSDYFNSGWLEWIKNNNLTIGAFIITGMSKLAIEFPEEIYKILIVVNDGR